jgi:PST family polysaccharide transporter
VLRNLAFNNLVLIAQYGVGGLVPLLLVPHIVRVVGLGPFGSLAVALAWANYGAVIVQYAFQYSGPRQLAQLRAGETEKTVVCRVASAKLVLLSGVLPAMGLVAVAMHTDPPQMSAAQGVLLLGLPLAWAMHSGWHLQAIGRFATVCGASIFGTLSALVVGFNFVRLDNEYALVAAAAALSLAPLIAGLGTLLASARLLVQQRQKAGWQAPWGELREGWPLFSSQFVSALYGISGPIIVAALAGLEQAGALSAVERVCYAIVGACMLTHTAAYPKLARLYGVDRKAYLHMLGTVIGVYLVAATCVVAAVLAYWDLILHFLFGAQATEYGSLVAAALVWLLLGIFGTALTGYLTVSGQGHAVLPLTLRILTLTMCIGIPGVLAFGAWAWMAALAASQGLVLAAGCRAWRAEARANLAGRNT